MKKHILTLAALAATMFASTEIFAQSTGYVDGKIYQKTINTSPFFIYGGMDDTKGAYMEVNPDRTGQPGYVRVISGINTGSELETFGVYNRKSTGWTCALLVRPNGNVLINKSNQTAAGETNYKLDVEGKARFTEVVVNTTGTYPDYVFDKDYKLKPLAEVEKYINENHHLEGIPTTKEAEVNGMSLGELNTKLLEKVEELTLYMIQLKKQNDEVMKKNNELETKINQLQKVSK